MLPHSENGLSVVVTATEMEHTFHIQEHERLLLKRQHLPVLPTQVEVDAVGEGCALVQASSVQITMLLVALPVNVMPCILVLVSCRKLLSQEAAGSPEITPQLRRQ
jgi:hypothetical protein